MSDLKLLKQKIYNEEKIEKLLEELDCHNIKHEQAGQLITAGLPEGDNRRSIQIRNSEELYTSIRSRGIDGDIYSLVGYIVYNCNNFDEVKNHLYQIKQWVCNALEYDDFRFNVFDQPKPKVDWNWWLRPIQNARAKEYNVTENEVIDEAILHQYINYPWYGWYQDGISIDTQCEFGVSFDIQSERIVIPIHNAKGQLIGIKGRYVGSNMNTLEEKKYIYLYPCSKSIELFNIHRAIPYIQEKKECIIVEAAKTVMLLHSFNVKNVVAIEGDKMSPVQAKLLKQLGFDIELVFAWDKDKDAEFIKQQTKQIKNRIMYCTWDDQNLFYDLKASPADEGYDVWMKLYENRHKHKLS